MWETTVQYWHLAYPYIIWGTTVLLFMIGLLGCLLPVLPGPAIIYAGMIFHKICLYDHSISLIWLILLGIPVAFTFVMDYILALMGAKKFGATKAGAWGALIGGFICLFIPPFLIWVLIGPFVGALVGELIAGNKLHMAARVGWGSFLGTMAGYVTKFTVSFLIIGAFAIMVCF